MKAWFKQAVFLTYNYFDGTVTVRGFKRGSPIASWSPEGGLVIPDAQRFETTKALRRWLACACMDLYRLEVGAK